MRWEQVLTEGELVDGGHRVVRVAGDGVLIVRRGDRVYATADHCTHMRLPLKRGHATDDDGFVCPWHRTVFDLATGAVREWVTWPPGVRRALGVIGASKPLQVYPAKLDQGAVWVGLED